jgi:arylsulfatase A-like enzyme
MSTRPNVLFITTDHLRYDILGYTGDPMIQTPAIDALAEKSLRFSNCFVQNPVCSPSRATFMTGRYPKNHGVRWNGAKLNYDGGGI